MKKPLSHRNRICSFPFMMGICLIIIQELYCCPIPLKEVRMQKLVFTRASSHTADKPAPDLMMCRTGISACMDRCQFFFYEPYGFSYSGLERLLDYSPEIDFDFLKTFFTGKPHGKWTLDDIWAGLFYSSGPVPEPSTMLILGSGLIGIALFGRRPND